MEPILGSDQITSNHTIINPLKYIQKKSYFRLVNLTRNLLVSLDGISSSNLLQR
jgi:hypothetical protein